jgi:hypothetical protein
MVSQVAKQPGKIHLRVAGLDASPVSFTVNRERFEMHGLPQ